MQENYGKAIKFATNQMNKSLSEYAKQFGLTGVQMSVIDFIGVQGSVLQRDIEAEFNIKRSTATLILQRMEKSGLIQQRRATTDKRQKEVCLAPKAISLYDRVSAYIQQQQQAIDGQFSLETRQAFLEVLRFFIKLNGGEENV
ncbi:MarR family winged helix-turn-helix transcriptional regulator [Loigolactobacillus binensis]|uniref:MarR family winged helix-turn-helix transcriptional regulator n=1 Tax=Loigolactobacillus binensis TaxID=2559922 RepID=A0ABW3EEX8_9LACO|nr:MarR family winged helix-turn-helix transcriptional regulator [Loigolactobacillus binensis]